MPGADRVSAAPGLRAPQALSWSASGGSIVSTSAILLGVRSVGAANTAMQTWRSMTEAYKQPGLQQYVFQNNKRSCPSVFFGQAHSVSLSSIRAAGFAIHRHLGS